MARSPHYKGNDEGGYGNPPVSHQFRGEPGPGRPRGSKSIESALRRTFGKKVVRLQRDGKRTLIDAPEALAERALELGLKGPLVANIEARKLAEKYGPQEEKRQIDLSEFTEAELELYGYLACKALGEEPDPELGPSALRILRRVGEIVEQEAQLASEERWRELRTPVASAHIEHSCDENSEQS